MLEPTLPIRTVWRKTQDFAGTVWRSPWLTITALALLAVQTVRVDGLQIKAPLIGNIGPQGWKPRALEAEATLKRVSEAQVEAERKARDAKASEEAALKELAKGNDNATIEKLQDDLARARDFIARNRVQPQGDRGAACGPFTPAPDRSAGHDEPTGGAPVMDATGLVAVPEADILICTRNTVLAEQWRAWGLALEARGSADDK